MAESQGGVNAVKLLGEAIIPGTSLVIDGDLKGGGIHLLGGMVGKAVLGPVGWIWAAANSYSRSVSGKNAHEHFLG